MRQIHVTSRRITNSLNPAIGFTNFLGAMGVRFLPQNTSTIRLEVTSMLCKPTCGYDPRTVATMLDSLSSFDRITSIFA